MSEKERQLLRDRQRREALGMDLDSPPSPQAIQEPLSPNSTRPGTKSQVIVELLMKSHGDRQEVFKILVNHPAFKYGLDFRVKGSKLKQKELLQRDIAAAAWRYGFRTQYSGVGRGRRRQ